jgi:outer membrane protein TolC
MRGFTALVRTLAAACAVVPCACTVGPNFTPPKAQTPAVWHDMTRTAANAGSPSASASANRPAAPRSTPNPSADPDPHWWHSFGDPVLDSLVERALAGNPDLQEAVLRIEEARVQAQQAAAQGLPNVRASASYEREQLGLKGLLQSQGVYEKLDALGPAVDRIAPGSGAEVESGARAALDQLTAPVNLWQAGFDASWELDLFGRVRRSVEAAKARTQEAVESQRAAQVSLEAEVAQTYLQLRGAQVLRALAVSLVKDQGETVALARNRAQHGLESALDLERAQAQRDQIAALVPQYDQQIAQALNGLAVLTGAAPGALDAELATPAAALPATPPSVPVGLPATLARRRPDIRRAEAALHAATANVGVAVAQFYPDISLSGQAGFRATEPRDLAHWSSLFWS